MTNKKLLAAIVSASAILTGCGSSSSTDSSSFLEKSVESTPRSIVSAPVDHCSEFGGDLIDNDQVCALPNRITATGGSFDAALTYRLYGVTLLGYGDNKLEKSADVQWLQDNAVNLTIPAGTTIEGKAGSALVVTRGAQLNALGSAAAPIIFESDDDNLSGSSEWGGIVVQGFGISNKCPDTGICNILGEGGVGYYGGDNNADTSGTLNYVIVTEGGYEVSVDNELNGVSFMAVGSGTNVDYLQVNENSDDGVEFWGGAVVVKHLVLTANQDDSIDWDNGWVGGIQYAIVTQEAGKGDHLFETDNDGKSMDSTPRSMPTIANVTAISSGKDTGIKHREGTGAKFYNVVVTEAAAARCVDIDDQATADQIDTGLIYTNVVLDCSTLSKTGSDCSTDKDGAIVCNGEENQEFAEDLLASQVSKLLTGTDIKGALNGYAWIGEETITAPVIENVKVTANTYFGAMSDVNDDWYSAWIVNGSL